MADDEDMEMERRILMEVCKVAWSSIVLLPKSDSLHCILDRFPPIVDALLDAYVKMHNNFSSNVTGERDKWNYELLTYSSTTLTTSKPYSQSRSKPFSASSSSSNLMILGSLRLSTRALSNKIS